MTPIEQGHRLTMTRTLNFSAGHRYWRSDLSDHANRELFGRWASPYNHGHNYKLEVTVAGDPDPENGMIVNIKTIDEIVRERVLADFDQRSINDEVPGFDERVPTLENLLLDIWGRLQTLPHECELVELRLWETPLLFAELQIPAMKIQLTRIYDFAAAHRLHVGSYSDEQNVALFGKCNNAAGHGHNYTLEVTVSGEPDHETGMICDLTALDDRIGELVVDRYDHRHLNEDIPEFQGRSTSTENLVLEIFKRLDGQLPAHLERIRVHETARNAFEVSR